MEEKTMWGDQISPDAISRILDEEEREQAVRPDQVEGIESDTEFTGFEVVCSLELIAVVVAFLFYIGGQELAQEGIVKFAERMLRKLF